MSPRERVYASNLYLYTGPVLTNSPSDISILSTIDGSCHTSARSDSPILAPPSGTADHRTLHCAWAWKCLHLVKTQNVSIVDTTTYLTILMSSKTTFIISLAASDSVSFNDVQDHTRVSVFTFTHETSDEPKLEKVGEWRLGGCAGGVLCHKYGDGVSGRIESSRVESDHHKPDFFTLVYVDSLQRMMSHTIRLIPTAAVRPPVSPQSSHGGVIGLPNPLKVLRVTHSEVPDKAQSIGTLGRIEVDGQVELGVVSLEGTIMANRTVLKNDERRTIFWTESGLTVGAPPHDSLQPLICYRSFKHSPET